MVDAMHGLFVNVPHVPSSFNHGNSRFFRGVLLWLLHRVIPRIDLFVVYSQKEMDILGDICAPAGAVLFPALGRAACRERRRASRGRPRPPALCRVHRQKQPRLWREHRAVFRRVVAGAVRGQRIEGDPPGVPQRGKAASRNPRMDRL